jgi:heat shock protein HtpX
MGSMLDEETRRLHKQRNVFHSMLLFAGIGAVLALASLLLWGWIGVVITAAAVAGLFLLAPRVPPQALMRLYRARAVDPARGGQLIAILAELARRAELPTVPALYVVPSMTLNAFATGSRDHAAIAVTEGLLRQLTMREITGVLAHEVSHVQNNDLKVMGLADVMSRMTQPLSYVALMLAVLNIPGTLLGDAPMSWWAIGLLYAAPALSNLLQLGLSRTREYDADLEAAMLTGDPLGLASALRRLDSTAGRFWEDLMMPVPARRVPVPSVLRTHPETEERIARLLSLKRAPELPQIVVAETPMVSMVGWGPIEMRPRYRFPGVWF